MNRRFGKLPLLPLTNKQKKLVEKIYDIHKREKRWLMVREEAHDRGVNISAAQGVFSRCEKRGWLKKVNDRYELTTSAIFNLKRNSK